MKDEEGRNAGLTSKAAAAFLLATRKVIQIARQTGTPIIVWEEGRVKEIPADQVELAKIEREIDGTGAV
jgi:hypothetical protein